MRTCAQRAAVTPPRQSFVLGLKLFFWESNWHMKQLKHVRCASLPRAALDKGSHKIRVIGLKNNCSASGARNLAGCAQLKATADARDGTLAQKQHIACKTTAKPWQPIQHSNLICKMCDEGANKVENNPRWRNLHALALSGMNTHIEASVSWA
jgi:hypothetical protein